MNWNATYRGKDGRQDVIQIEASSKGEVFEQLSAKGISAIRVEAANGKARNRGSRKTNAWSGNGGGVSSYLFKGILAAIVLVVVVVVWMALSRKAEQEYVPDEKKTGLIQDFQSSIPTNETDNVSVEDTNTVEAVVEPQIKEPPPKKVIRPRSARTGRVMTLMDGTVVTNTPRVFFTRDFERSLHVALHPGGMASGLLRNIRAKYSDDEILSMLKELTLPDPDDDETAIGVKNKVQELKENILTAIDNGSSVSQVFDEMIRQCTSESLLRADAFKAKIEAIRTGDPEIVRDSMRQINEVLESSGLRKMDVPLQFQDPEDLTGREDVPDQEPVEAVEDLDGEQDGEFVE